MLHDFMVYDPRTQERVFRLADGRIWSSKKADVLAFETDIYALCTDGEFIQKLLEILISESVAEKLGLKITGYKTKSVPAWLEEVDISGDVLRSISGVYQINRVSQFFNRQADYQMWDLYGLTSDFRDLTVLKSLPNVLKYTTTFPFYMEVDLDGMLVGYITPKRELDFLIARLSDLSETFLSKK